MPLLCPTPPASTPSMPLLCPTPPASTPSMPLPPPTWLVSWTTCGGWWGRGEVGGSVGEVGIWPEVVEAARTGPSGRRSIVASKSLLYPGGTLEEKNHSSGTLEKNLSSGTLEKE